MSSLFDSQSYRNPTPQDCSVVRRDGLRSLVLLTLDASAVGDCSRCPNCTAVPKQDEPGKTFCTHEILNKDVPSFIWGSSPPAAAPKAESSSQFEDSRSAGVDLSESRWVGKQSTTKRKLSKKTRYARLCEKIDLAATVYLHAIQDEIGLNNGDAALWGDDPSKADEISRRASKASRDAQKALRRLFNKVTRAVDDQDFLSTVPAFRTKNFTFMLIPQPTAEIYGLAGELVIPVPNCCVLDMPGS